MFRTLVYSKSEAEAYSELCQTSTMECVAKTVNSCSSFRKLFSQYSFFIFSNYINKNLFFTPKVFIPYKNIYISRPRGA